MKKKTILDFYKMKAEGEKVSWITSYDMPFASFAEAAGIDMILVGDSLGMVVEGFQDTIPVTMDMCIQHCQAVRRGAPNTFVVGDMPFGSYQVSDEEAYTIASTIFENKDAIAQLHAKGLELDLEYASECGLNYHPGAAKYFAEKGFTVQVAE